MATNFTDLRAEVQAQIKPNGVGAITGQVMQDAMLSLVGATEAELSALNAETDAKVAQLSSEWQEIMDADFQLNIEVLPHISVENVSGGAAILQPDKLYDFGEVATLAVGFDAPLEGKAANYAFQFKSPASAPTSVTLPDSVVFPVESDSMFNVKAGRTYQVTILNNLASASSWEV